MSYSVVSDDTEGATATRSDVGGSDRMLGNVLSLSPRGYYSTEAGYPNTLCNIHY